MKSFLLILLYFLLVTQLQYPQWTNQNPVPDGNDLWSTFFIDDNTGWIVGSNGFIIKTTNAGLDWTQQTSGTTLTLMSVQFINQTSGWICGEDGLILKTTDAGQSWFELTSGTSELLSDLHFVDINTGWAVGFNETIIKTTNGGSSWNFQASDTSFNLRSVDFIDEFIGYAVGEKKYANLYERAQIFKTTDGGLNWIDKSSILSGYPGINTVEFIDSNVGWIGGGTPGYSGQAFIIKTTDGGETWGTESIFKSEIVRNRENLFIDNNFGIHSIYFRDANNGWAVQGNDTWKRAIYTTTNGGATWDDKYPTFPEYNNLVINEEYDLLSVFVNSIGQGWAVGRNGSIFITEDDGQSWAQQLSGGVQSGGEEDIYSLCFVNDTIGWAAGTRKNFSPGESILILKTTNGGKTWITKYYHYGSGPILKTVFFINENIGWAGGDDNILFTTNGGENWSWGSGDIHSISSIFFIDQNTGWATGAGIYKSTDGGNTWVQKSTVGGSSIYFFDINNGWVCGESGNIRKSTDGGETWITKTSGTTSNLNSVRFFNSNVGMCVGDV
ncbi:MAG: YCF48-related protein, partial [Ignavibacteria bacterium]|nr:YCF48-related protein [Ignavibacteria bacterium]